MKSSDTMQQFRAHWSDLASRCIRDSRPYFTDFVPVEDVPAAESIARSAGAVCTAWGGTENTTRVMLCFAPEFIPVEPEQFPIQCLTFSYRVPKPPAHRDFLGACMACNLERDTIGDILISDKMAQMFVCSQVAPVLPVTGPGRAHRCQRDGRLSGLPFGTSGFSADTGYDRFSAGRCRYGICDTSEPRKSGTVDSAGPADLPSCND